MDRQPRSHPRRATLAAGPPARAARSPAAGTAIGVLRIGRPTATIPGRNTCCLLGTTPRRAGRRRGSRQKIGPRISAASRGAHGGLAPCSHGRRTFDMSGEREGPIFALKMAGDFRRRRPHAPAAPRRHSRRRAGAPPARERLQRRMMLALFGFLTVARGCRVMPVEHHAAAAKWFPVSHRQRFSYWSRNRHRPAPSGCCRPRKAQRARNSKGACGSTELFSGAGPTTDRIGAPKAPHQRT